MSKPMYQEAGVLLTYMNERHWAFENE